MSLSPIGMKDHASECVFLWIVWNGSECGFGYPNAFACDIRRKFPFFFIDTVLTSG